MITQLSLSNFKSWRDPKPIRLAPLTAFFGSNSSGKTSLLQSLLLLKQTAESSDRGQALFFGDRSSLVDLGDFRTLVHGHDPKLALALGLEWEEASPLEIQNPAQKDAVIQSSDRLGFQTQISGLNGSDKKALRIRVDEMSYQLGGSRFGMRLKSPEKLEYDLTANSANFQFVRTVGRPWPLPPPNKCYGFPDEVRANHQNAGFLADLELRLERRLRSLYYLGPLRAFPERQYPWSGAQPEDMGRAGDQAVNALLASRERGELISLGKGNKRKTLEEYVAIWLRNLGLIHSFRIEPIAEGAQLYRVLVKKTATATEVAITDVGFGVSQILPVLVLCFYVPPGSTVILEQPEIHLHPAVQAGLADVFVDAWKRRNVQVIVESHSEHLLRRLQRRIAEEQFDHNNAAVYFCTADNGASSLRPLEIDMFGSIKNWPKDFFGDELGEIAAQSAARMKRKNDAK